MLHALVYNFPPSCILFHIIYIYCIFKFLTNIKQFIILTKIPRQHFRQIVHPICLANRSTLLPPPLRNFHIRKPFEFPFHSIPKFYLNAKRSPNSPRNYARTSRKNAPRGDSPSPSLHPSSSVSWKQSKTIERGRP